MALYSLLTNKQNRKGYRLLETDGQETKVPIISVFGFSYQECLHVLDRLRLMRRANGPAKKALLSAIAPAVLLPIVVISVDLQTGQCTTEDGFPQWGHATASEEICLPHSSHFISAIVFLLYLEKILEGLLPLSIEQTSGCKTTRDNQPLKSYGKSTIRMRLFCPLTFLIWLRS